MKTLRYSDWKTLCIADAPTPVPEPGEVLLRVSAAGICGSELEAVKNQSPRRVPPRVMGHEFCGVIADVGPNVDANEFWTGRRVVSNSLVGCEACVRCKRGDTHLCEARQLFGMHRPGAWAEFVCVPTRALLAWPDGLPDAAAALAEPCANGVHMARLAAHRPPETLLVIGAGPIGLFAQQAFQALYQTRVFVADVSAGRLTVAKKLGAVQTFHVPDVDIVEAIRDLTEGEGADMVIDAAGRESTKQQSIAALRPGGAAIWIGIHDNEISLKSFEVTLAEKAVWGTYAATLPDVQAALNLMASGQIDGHSWVQRFPLTRGAEAFFQMMNPGENDIKAVLVP